VHLSTPLNPKDYLALSERLTSPADFDRPPQHLRQLGEVRRHAAGLVAGEQLGRRPPTGFLLEMIRAATPAATRMIK